MNENKRNEEVYRLEEKERSLIIEALEDITKGKEISAICAYGSRIAGYAREESDYDVIVALKNYKPKVRYNYIRKGIDLAALTVDSKSLVKDAEVASLGEFVAGRLLNVYEALIGKDFIKDVEIKLKRRVTFEILDDVALAYGDFSTKLIIPIKYILFEKLKKRASLYPLALYSYVKTYTGKLGKENLKVALKGFLKPLKEMESYGLVSLLDEESLRMEDEYLRLRKVGKIKTTLSYTKRGVISYAVHGYAGHVGLDVIKREILSKIDRSKEIVDVPEDIKHPKNLWRIDEGLLIVESDDWLQQILSYLGLSKETKIIQLPQGKLYETLKVYMLKDRDKVINIAVKNFKDIKTLKWAFLNLWALPTRWFEMSSLTRLGREYVAMRKLREIGLNTPEIISIVLNKRIMVTNFIEGMNLGKIVKDILSGYDANKSAISMYGESIAHAHKYGYSLGDTKPSNAILSNGKIFITDLEQASEHGDKAWDIALFLYYSNKLTLNASGARVITQEFLKGYLKAGSVDIVKEALNSDYLAPFQTVLAPNVIKVIRDEISKAIVSS
jgi:tRNA A-37 threonylcarbamoyl transferase component Bud32/predicted nucleotidyltransferase